MNTSGTADSRWMERALELAARGRFGTSPNPMVGAVVLDDDGLLIAEGFHSRFGGPHAEVVALDAAGEKAAGGTLFVNLEPCSHHGKTPPCVKAILEAGLRRVVVAVRDPNPTAAGGVEQLLEAGVEVTVGPGTDGARQLNRRWLKWASDRQPWVTMKAAVSLDGRIATHTGESKWITGTAARRRGHELREEHDAILVGVATVLADDPSLARHLNLNPERRWRKIVLDSKLRTPAASRLLRESPEQVLLVHGPGAPERSRSALARTGAQTVEIPVDENGRLDLARLLSHLGSDGVSAILVEGGATVHGSFVDADLVDEAVFFIAPLIIGGPAPAAVAGHGIGALADATRFHFESCTRLDGDLEARALRSQEEHVHRAD